MAFNRSFVHFSPRPYPRLQKIVGCLVILVILVIVILAGTAVFSIPHYVNELQTELYAQEWAANTVIQYMEWNGGSWPRSWVDLEEPFEAFYGDSSDSEAFQTMRSRVVIDFSANPTELAKVPMPPGNPPRFNTPPFRVFSLRSGRQHYGGEPNTLVWEYLQKRAQRPANYQYPHRPIQAEKQARKALLKLGARWELDSTGRITGVKWISNPEHLRFSDADLVWLRSLTAIRELDLSYCHITDDGLASIKDLTSLRRIDLYGTQVTDDGLKHLDKMQQLDKLVMGSKTFTDRAFVHIVKHPSLTLLNLNDSRVTDSGITSLHKMVNLREIMLYNTQVTADGARKLRTALPHCKVSY
jgi:hypothetical protein